MADEPYDCDVLIAGGGPTGITLAILLARRGVAVLVCEKEAAIYPLPRAAHVDHETMRVLQATGAADAIAATSRTSPRYDFVNAKGKILLRFDGVDALGEGGWPLANMIHQPSLEAALRAELARLPTARLWCLAEVTGNTQDQAGVTATVVRDGAAQTIRARYLVGADGARSPVREAAGITFDDLGFEEPWLVVDAVVQDPARMPQINLQICDPARPTTCVAMGEGRHRWEFMIKPGEDAAEISSDASVWRMLAPWDVEGAITLERKAVYTFRARVAERWRAGRVLLAGDAAHQTPPFAGQGLCAGVRDAVNLAWKLAAILIEGADPAVLDSYQLEREPHARAVIAMATMMGRTVCITNPLAAWWRDTKLTLARWLRLSPDGPPQYPPLRAGLILDGSKAAGTYFPQAVVPGSPPLRLDDGLPAGPVLIARHAPTAAGLGLATLSVKDPTLAPFWEPLTRWLDKHGAEAVLVRPDRYVFGTGSVAALQVAWVQALGAHDADATWPTAA